MRAAAILQCAVISEIVAFYCSYVRYISLHADIVHNNRVVIIMISVWQAVMMMHNSVTVRDILHDYHYNFDNRIQFIEPAAECRHCFAL